jgi:hypothetical protein
VEISDARNRGEVLDRIVGYALEQTDRRMRGIRREQSVYPSGFARATVLAAIKPPAPALFSMTKGWPSSSCRYWPMRRAAASDWLPAANGVMMVTVRA